MASLASPNDVSILPSSLTTTDRTPAYSSQPKPTCNIVTPVGMLGYGLHAKQSASELALKQGNGAPTAIVLDSGSTDSGPEKLALGCMSVPRGSYKRDLRKLINLAWEFRVPLIFSSVGGSGSDEHVEEMTNVVREICEEPGKEYMLFSRSWCSVIVIDFTADGANRRYRLKTITIFSGMSKTLVSDRFQNHMLSGCGKTVPPLTQRAIPR